MLKPASQPRKTSEVCGSVQLRQRGSKSEDLETCSNTIIHMHKAKLEGTEEDAMKQKEKMGMVRAGLRDRAEQMGCSCDVVLPGRDVAPLRGTLVEVPLASALCTVGTKCN